MKQEYLDRTFQWIVMVGLFFFGPVGWVLIYLLWTKWNPPTKKRSTTKKTKTASSRKK